MVFIDILLCLIIKWLSIQIVLFHLFQSSEHPLVPTCLDECFTTVLHSHLTKSASNNTFVCENSLALNLISVDTHIFRPWHGCLFQDWLKTSPQLLTTLERYVHGAHTSELFLQRGRHCTSLYVFLLLFNRFRYMTCWHYCCLNKWKTRFEVHCCPFFILPITPLPSHISPSPPQVLCNHLPTVAPQLHSHCATELSSCLEEDNPAKLLKPLLKMVLKLVVTLRRKEEVNNGFWHPTSPMNWRGLWIICPLFMYHMCIHTHTHTHTHSCLPSWTPPSSSPSYTPSPPIPHSAPTWKKSVKNFRRPSLVMLPWQQTSRERDQNTRKEENNDSSSHTVLIFVHSFDFKKWLHLNEHKKSWFREKRVLY